MTLEDHRRAPRKLFGARRGLGGPWNASKTHQVRAVVASVQVSAPAGQLAQRSKKLPTAKNEEGQSRMQDLLWSLYPLILWF